MKHIQSNRIKSKRYLIFFIAFLAIFLFPSCSKIIDAFTGASKPMKLNGNSLYHQTETSGMKTGELEILGEVEKQGKVNFKDFYTREVYVKEMLQSSSIDTLIGAYRYIGYSLFDLLHPFNQNKKSMEKFKPLTDLYVIIENDAGEQVVFSWAEIFLVNNPHQIIIATENATIEPYRKEVNYPVAKIWKVVAANDLYAYRWLENPSKIKVVSFDKKEYPIIKGMKPMYSPDVKVIINNKILLTIPEISDSSNFIKYRSCFYGMGMGYHPAPYFQGPVLNDFLKDSIDLLSPELIKHGLISTVGLDGYRAVYSFSELFNRTDQIPAILAIVHNKHDGGYYRIFHPSDFYADRSVKGLAEIYFFEN